MTPGHTFNAEQAALVIGMDSQRFQLLLRRNKTFDYGLPVSTITSGKRSFRRWAIPDLMRWFLFARLLEGHIAPAVASAVVRLVGKGITEAAPVDPPRYAVIDLMAAPVLNSALWVADGEPINHHIGLTSYVVDTFAMTQAVLEAVELLPMMEAARGRKLGRTPRIAEVGA
jgi:hypothetical protein